MKVSRTARSLSRPKSRRSQETPIRGLGCAAVLGAAILVTVPVLAQSTTEAAKDEARDHFDRGLRLFNQLDNEGALAEFTRAYELVPNAQVLKNIGLVQAAMQRPVQAVEAFDRLLGDPAGLDAASLERIRTEREHQLARVARLEVVATVPNAVVEVDGIEAGRTPLPTPLRLAQGSHVVSVVAAGHVPLRKQLNLVGATSTKVDFALIASDSAFAHLEIRSRVPNLELFVDGEAAGQTPLAASLAIAPGAHRLEARRVGYRTVSQDVLLGPGTTGAIDINPDVDTNALVTEGGSLSLSVSEPGAILFVDGESRGPYTTPVQLVPGTHWVRLEHADFFPVERRVSVVPRGTTEYVIELKPTPNKLERYQSTTRRRSTWGWVTTVTGTALAAGSVGFIWYNSGQKSDKSAVFDEQVARARPGGDCDPKGIQNPTCRTELELALSGLERARDRDVYGWIGLGVGGAAVGIGLYLLLGNDDPNRFAPKPQSDVFGRHRVAPTAWLAANTAGAALTGTF